MEEEPLYKKPSFFSQSFKDIEQISRDIQALHKAALTIEESSALRERLQSYAMRALDHIDIMEKEKNEETKKRIFWRTVSITQFVLMLFTGLTFILMLYAAR